jgi:hypothetical protein
VSGARFAQILSTSAASAAASAGASAAAKMGGTMEALRNYNEYLARNTRYSDSLSKLFAQLTADHPSGGLELATALPQLIAAGTVSKQNAATMRSWDLNGDGVVDKQEFVMGPLCVNLLQYNPTKRAEFERLVATDGNTSEYTKMFVRMAAGSADDLPEYSNMRFMERDSSGKTEEQLAMDAEVEAAEKQEEAELAADDTYRFAQRHGRRRKKNANAAARAAELLAQKRPRSKHGIPSEADEHCVMCQFLVQRIQKQLYFTLANSNDGFPADPNSEIPAKKMREVNSQLLNRRGGKGMLRILAEDMLSDMCDADTMPELFYSTCKKIDKVFPVLLDAIYFQFNSEAVCEESKLCSARTYFNRDSSVHLPSKSVVFNSGRGKCGLMGGSRERPDTIFSSAVCFGGMMFRETEAALTPAL